MILIDGTEGSTETNTGTEAPSETLRGCTACRVGKPLSAFAKDAKGKGGLKAKCRECVAKLDKSRKGKGSKAPAPATETKPEPEKASAPKAKKPAKKAARKPASAKKTVKRAKAAAKTAKATREPAARSKAGKTVKGEKRKNVISMAHTETLRELYKFMAAKPRTAREIREKFKCAKPTAYIRIEALKALGVKMTVEAEKRYVQGPAAEVYTITSKEMPEALKAA